MKVVKTINVDLDAKRNKADDIGKVMQEKRSQRE